MSELLGLAQANAALRQQNEALLRQVAEANQAIEALVKGEVDAVALAASETPLLLHAAQEKLRRNEGILRAVFDSSLDANVLADDGDQFIDVNPAACALFGMNRQELLGRSLREFAGQGDADANSWAFGQPPGPMRGQFVLKRRDGTQRIIDFSAIRNVVPGLHLSVLRDATEQVTTEQALRANRSLLEEAQAIAHIGSWSCGTAPDDELVWSAECYRIFGIASATAMTVAAFFELVHPEDRERTGRHSRDAIERGTAYEVEHRIVRPDGEVRWVHERAIVVRDEGLPTRLVGTAQDVTDRHLNVEALRKSEAEFRLLAETMPQLVWITRPDGGNVYFNQRWMDYTGLGLERSLVEGWSEPVHPEEQELAQQAWRNATATIGTYSIECRLRRADGVYRWWLIRGEPVRDAKGNVLKWFGTCTDIEAIKQVEARLRENEGLLRVAGRVARLGGWSVSIPKFELTWSDEVCAIHEVAAGTVPTLEQAVSYYAPECREDVRSKVEACIHEGIPFDLEVPIITASGRRLWVRAIGDAERNATGAITRIRGAFQDIDDRRKLQEQLRQSQKMEAMGQLAGGVAHDFNNILGIILSYGILIRDALPEGDTRRNDVLEVLSAAERAGGLTSQLLAFARQQAADKRPTDLNESVVQLHRLLARTLGDHIEFSVTLSPRPVVVKIDPLQFDQLALNLVLNARDAMPHGGTLRVAFEHVAAADDNSAGRVRLKVTDTGAGMDEQTQQRIFEPFFTTKEVGRGTGLGLATVWHLITEMSGRIEVESTLGEGSAFHVFLPMFPIAAASRPPDPVDLRTTTFGSRIFLAEDDEFVAKAIVTILNRQNQLVTHIADGAKAWHHLERHAYTYQLVVLDVNMPGMDGLELARRLRQNARYGGKLMIISGRLASDDMDQLATLQVHTILPKPFAVTDFLEALRSALQEQPSSGAVAAK